MGLRFIGNLFIFSHKIFRMDATGGSSGNTALIESLKKKGIVKTDVVEKIMKQVDRGHYAPEEAVINHGSLHAEVAYEDRPVPIGHGATISAPHMHAHALELLVPAILNHPERPRVLDVGSGSGYLSVAFARLVAPLGGTCTGIDYLQSLVDLGTANIRKADQDLIDSGVLKIYQGDGWKGDPQNAPFQVIHVGAGAESMPEALVEQLAPGGRMVIPIEGAFFGQDLMFVEKSEDNKVTMRNMMAVRYVPLVKV